MPGLIDLGGGVKMADPRNFTQVGGGDPTGQLANVLTLGNLIEQRKQAPLLKKKLEAETAIKMNELLNVDVDNLYKRAQLESAVSKEGRDKAKFAVEHIGKVIDLFQIDASLGESMLKMVVPSATVEKAEDGTHTVTMHGRKFLVDPNKITDPEKRRTFEKDERNTFIREGNAFKQRAEGWRIIKDLLNKDGEPSGAKDLAGMRAFFMILEPGGRVTEGEVVTAENLPSVPVRFINMYNKNINSKAPMFGEKGSETRQQFVDATKVIFEKSMEDMIAFGENTHFRTDRQGLDPLNVLTPVGALRVEDFLPAGTLTNEQLLERIARQKELLGD